MVAPRSEAEHHDRLELVLLQAEAGRAEVEKICALAGKLGVAAMCVGGAQVARARMLLEETGVRVSALVGFPLGAMESDVKRYEIEAAVDCGAQEIDAVLNHGWIRDGEFQLLQREVRDLAEAADEQPVKFILEPGWLRTEELVQAVKSILETDARMIALATGLGPREATRDDLELVRSMAGDAVALKVTVKFEDRQTIEQFVTAGAMRIGVTNWERLGPGGS